MPKLASSDGDLLVRGVERGVEFRILNLVLFGIMFLIHSGSSLGFSIMIAGV